VQKIQFYGKLIENQLLYQSCGLLIVMQRLTALLMIAVNDKCVFFREFGGGGRRPYVSPMRHIAAYVSPMRYIASYVSPMRHITAYVSPMRHIAS
jgi:hypothetical protein